MCLTASLLSEENDCVCVFLFSFLIIYVKFTKYYVDFDVAMKQKSVPTTPSPRQKIFFKSLQTHHKSMIKVSVFTHSSSWSLYTLHRESHANFSE